MFNLKKIIILIMSIALTAGVAVKAPALDTDEEWLGEKPEWMPDISLENAFFTKYIWRGQNLGDEPVMQTDFSVSKWGLTFDFWTNYTLNNDKSVDSGRYQEYTEIDYTIDYSFNFGELSESMEMDIPEMMEALSMSFGYTYYTFPNTDWNSEAFDSHEVYAGVSYDCLLQPFFTWYWDVDDGDGSYYIAGISHTLEFDGGITADVGMTTAYNDEQWTPESGWSDMNFSGSVTIPFMNYFYVTPSVSYSLILDRDTYEDAQENEFYGGIAVGFSY